MKKLEIAIEWYLDALSHGAVEIMFIKACTCLEILKTINLKDKILTRSYWRKIKRLLEKTIEENVTNDETIADMTSKLPEINRKSYKKLIKLFLDGLNIPYKDILCSGEERYKFIKIRNKIVHAGNAKPFTAGEVLDEHAKLIALLDRVFLTVIKYDGYYKDRLSGKYQPFKDHMKNLQENNQ